MDRWFNILTCGWVIKSAKMLFWAWILWYPLEYVWIWKMELCGRRPLYGSTMHAVTINDQHVVIPAGESTEVKAGAGSPKSKLWVRNDPRWVPTVTSGPGQIKYLQLTNLSDRDVILNHGAPLGWWMAADMIPRSPGYVSVGSRRYKVWQTLAFEATTDRKEDPPEESTGPLVDHPTYPHPRKS